MDISMAVLSSILVVLAVIEMGGVWPWLVYGVTSLLALLLLPSKLPGLYYLLFAGFYPILKEKIEGRISLRVVRVVVKLGVFAVCMGILWIVCRLFLPDVSLTLWPGFTAAILCVIFVLYDFALSRLITAYLFVWRKRLKIKKL